MNPVMDNFATFKAGVSGSGRLSHAIPSKRQDFRKDLAAGVLTVRIPLGGAGGTIGRTFELEFSLSK